MMKCNIEGIKKRKIYIKNGKCSKENLSVNELLTLLQVHTTAPPRLQDVSDIN